MSGTNNEQMWRCLYSSLTEEAKAMLLTYKKDYEILVNGEPKLVAPLLYKTIMRLATLDGNATITTLRAILHELTQYTIKQNGNINKIHTNFNQNYVQLKARGQSVNDVHTILFEACLQGVPDATFHNYMRLQDDWTDPTGDIQDPTHEDIIKKAKAKYDLLVNSGKWGDKSPDQEKNCCSQDTAQGSICKTSSSHHNSSTSSSKVKSKARKDISKIRNKKEPMLLKNKVQGIA